MSSGHKYSDRALQRREMLLVLAPSALLMAAGLWLAYQFVEPAPPRTVVMSTGSAKGAYHVVGQRYVEVLARDGVKLEPRTSRGSKENAARLLDRESGVKIALMQGGARHPRSVALRRRTLPSARTHRTRAAADRTRERATACFGCLRAGSADLERPVD